MSDVEEQFVEFDDELLIAIVQGNPCLYAKNDKNFKNNKLKDMKWEVIAGTLKCTGELLTFLYYFANKSVVHLCQYFFCILASEARKCWDSLRNQFCRKRRQQKNQPSGSGTLAEWPLMSSMSFLTSHIQNRK